MTKSSAEMANTTAAEAKVAGGLLVLPADREQPTAHDHDHEGDREGHVAEDLGDGSRVNEREDVAEDEEERHAHDYLGRDQRKKHDEVGEAGAATAPAGETEGEQNPDRDSDENVRCRQLEALNKSMPKRRVVPDRVHWIPPVPACREGVPDGARAGRVEGELHRDQHRHDRPQDVAPGDDDQEARPSPRVAEPAAQAGQGRGPRLRSRLGNGRHSAPTVPASRWARWMLLM